MKRLIKVVSIILIICMGLTGCGSSLSNVTPDNNKEELSEISYVDSAEREVIIPKEIKRVAVTGSLSQMMVLALAPDLLVGLASEWDSSGEMYLDEEYYTLPVVGQLYGSKGDLNLESLLATDPQIIIDIGETKGEVATDMDSLQNKVGLPVVHISAYLNNTGEAFRELGKILGYEERAEELANYCERLYDTTEELMSEIGDRKKSILYCLGDKGTNVIPKQSYQGEVINMIANNEAVVDNPSSKGTGNEVDLEQILIWNPEVIIFSPESIYDTVKNYEEWNQLNAIKENKYYEVPFNLYNWMGFPPSVQRYLGMIWLAELLYPEYTKLDLKEEVTKYYELFYHVQLSDEQYNEIVRNSIGKIGN